MNQKRRNRHKKKSGRRKGRCGQKNGVPDTAHDCPILRTGVACEKSVPEIKILCKGGVIWFSYTAFSHTTRPPSSAAFYSGRCRRGNGDPVLTVGGR